MTATRMMHIMRRSTLQVTMRNATIAALQIGSQPDGTAATLDRILSHASSIRNAGAQLVVMPEALLGGYPKGADFGARVGYRTPEGRDAFLKYWREAIEVPGPQTEALGELARNTGAAMVVGVIERDTTTLYCTALFFSSGGQLVGKHRKLVPTAMERLIWGQGDGSTLFAMQTAAGRVGAAICWENYMPLLRTAMYAKGLDIWCAPTVDERDIWQTSMRHIAYEGRLFVISACQYQPPPAASAAPDWPRDRPLIRGGSIIVSPLGDVLAGPVYNREELLVATIDRDDVVRGRYDLDVIGHYARPDVFTLTVDEGSPPARS
jgi:nitrilase